MVATFSSLPPEIVLEILGHLPRPAPIWHRQLVPAPERSSLLSTSLVNKQLRHLSQRIMFARVIVKGPQGLQEWSVSGARKWTVWLSIWLEEDRLENAGGGGWVENQLRAGLRGKVEGQGAKLEVLRFGLNLYPAEVGAGVLQIAELQGLDCLEIAYDNLTPNNSSLVPLLRRLNLLTAFLPKVIPPLSLPLLTHLSLDQLPTNPPDLASAFPSLTHLAIDNLPRSGSVPTLPASVAHFATHSPVTVALCQALSAVLASLTIDARLDNDLASIGLRWFTLPSGAVGRTEERTLERLVVRTPDAPTEGAVWLGSGPGAQARLQAAVAAFRGAGCVVEFRRPSDLEWLDA